MQRLSFETQINADRGTVWKVLWSDATYPEWTRVFSENSRAKSDWKEGSRVEFLDGDRGGMYSRIDKLKPNEFTSFKHLGSIKDGKDIPFGDDLVGWAGSFEDYRLVEEGLP